MKRRQEYTRRIIKAVNFKGDGDHEDVPSILYEFQEEIIKEHNDKIVKQLEEMRDKADNYQAASCTSDEINYYTGLENGFIKAIEIVKSGGKV